jgi:hypothetical protein
MMSSFDRPTPIGKKGEDEEEEYKKRRRRRRRREEATLERRRQVLGIVQESVKMESVPHLIATQRIRHGCVTATSF